MVPNPKPGMRVRFCQEGLRQLGGLTSIEEIDAHNKGVHILKVNDVGITCEDGQVQMLDVVLEHPFKTFMVTNYDIVEIR